mmetsp:Transcript_9128/g.13684  ORF Transcript_9128/g.13684 Transcript_9128/m.13684 type:complete len:295 (+) Transcript_9128:159-1043(+)
MGEVMKTEFVWVRKWENLPEIVLKRPPLLLQRRWYREISRNPFWRRRRTASLQLSDAESSSQSISELLKPILTRWTRERKLNPIKYKPRKRYRRTSAPRTLAEFKLRHLTQNERKNPPSLQPTSSQPASSQPTSSQPTSSLADVEKLAENVDAVDSDDATTVDDNAVVMDVVRDLDSSPAPSPSSVEEKSAANERAEIAAARKRIWEAQRKKREEEKKLQRKKLEEMSRKKRYEEKMGPRNVLSNDSRKSASSSQDTSTESMRRKIHKCMRKMDRIQLSLVQQFVSTVMKIKKS